MEENASMSFLIKPQQEMLQVKFVFYGLFSTLLVFRHSEW
jgi:hypothetical protein